MTEDLWCPSGAAFAPEALVLGVRTREDGPVRFLDAPLAAAPALAALPEGSEPRRFLRLASPCVAHCLNRDGARCTLADRLTARTPAAPVSRCALRPRCTWWHQTGPEACRRCPEVDVRPEEREP
ncbi:hypothetical protein ABT160_06085 [Streptomyces sp. NPDC001941]|uniref:hypothetical protein n=1 Tax=Streptomyces sp. NPDC001941 TaxID=3154659 RepID=UPI0033195436